MVFTLVWWDWPREHLSSCLPLFRAETAGVGTMSSCAGWTQGSMHARQTPTALHAWPSLEYYLYFIMTLLLKTQIQTPWRQRSLSCFTDLIGWNSTRHKNLSREKTKLFWGGQSELLENTSEKLWEYYKTEGKEHSPTPPPKQGKRKSTLGLVLELLLDTEQTLGSASTTSNQHWHKKQS